MHEQLVEQDGLWYYMIYGSEFITYSVWLLVYQPDNYVTIIICTHSRILISYKDNWLWSSVPATAVLSQENLHKNQQ